MKNLKIKIIFLLVSLIMLILLLFTSCNPIKELFKISDEKYQHHMIEEGYLRLDNDIEKFEEYRVRRICKKLGKDYFKSVEFRVNKFIAINETLRYTKYESYIPVTIEDFNKTKTNIFGKEKFIINRNLRKKYVPQIE